jgi:hypothetical protein
MLELKDQTLARNQTVPDIDFTGFPQSLQACGRIMSPLLPYTLQLIIYQ